MTCPKSQSVLVECWHVKFWTMVRVLTETEISKLEYKTTNSVNNFITCIHRCRNSVCQGRGGWVPRSIFCYGTLLCELYNFEFFEGSECLQLKSSTTTPSFPKYILEYMFYYISDFIKSDHLST